MGLWRSGNSFEQVGCWRDWMGFLCSLLFLKMGRKEARKLEGAELGKKGKGKQVVAVMLIVHLSRVYKARGRLSVPKQNRRACMLAMTSGIAMNIDS